jgi:hypothetical protein
MTERSQDAGVQPHAPALEDVVDPLPMDSGQGDRLRRFFVLHHVLKEAVETPPGLHDALLFKLLLGFLELVQSAELLFDLRGLWEHVVHPGSSTSQRP